MIAATRPAPRARLLVAASFLAFGLSGGAAFAQEDGSKVIAKVDGLEITEGELAIAEEEIGSSIRGAEGEAKRAQLIQYLADIKTGAKAAREKKLSDAPDYKRKLAYFADKILLDQLLNDAVKTGLTDEALKKLYDDSVKNLTPEMEVRARHILVETEDEIKQVLERLGKGEDFAALAKELSKDPGSGKDGGDLGFFEKGKMVKEFDEVAFTLDPGKLSAPIKTQFGWHVLKVEERRVKELPKFEDVKPQIVRYMTQQIQRDFIIGQRGKHKVERLDAPKP